MSLTGGNMLIGQVVDNIDELLKRGGQPPKIGAGTSQPPPVNNAPSRFGASALTAPAAQPALPQTPTVGAPGGTAPFMPAKIGASPQPAMPSSPKIGAGMDTYDPSQSPMPGGGQPDYAAQYAAVHDPVKPGIDAGKPSMLRKIGGIALGAGIGAFNPQAGAQIGSSIVHGPRNELMRQYNQDEGLANQQRERIKTEAGLADTGSQMEQRQAQAVKDRAEAAKAGQPPATKEPKTAESGGQAYQFNEQTGRYDIPIGSPKAPVQSGEDKAISDHLQAKGLPDTPANRDKARREVKLESQLPQRPERTLMEIPQPDGSSKIVEATPGMTIPKGAKPASKIGSEDKVTADEQRRSDLSKNMNENLDKLEDIITRRPELFGPAAGRITGAKQWLGTADPDVAALQTIQEQTGMAMVGAHAMRNAQHVEKAANAIMNAYKNKPEAMLGPNGSIAAARSSIQTFINDADKGKTGGSAPAAKGTWNPQTGRYE